MRTCWRVGTKLNASGFTIRLQLRLSEVWMGPRMKKLSAIASLISAMVDILDLIDMWNYLSRSKKLLQTIDMQMSVMTA